MKATKLMALGLVGLTTLGLASTANAESVNTEASVTFSVGDQSGNQDGPNGEVKPENPVVETPNAVNGWKLAVPEKMVFKGNEADGTWDGTVNIYNPSTSTNNYKYEGVAYKDGDPGDFFLRFEAESEKASTGTYSVSVSRGDFLYGGKVLDVTNTSYIQFPAFTKFVEENTAIVGSLKDSKGFKLENKDSGTDVLKVNLDANQFTDGFAVAAKDEIMLHIGGKSKQITKSGIVTTVLTWTFAADQTSGEGL